MRDHERSVSESLEAGGGYQRLQATEEVLAGCDTEVCKRWHLSNMSGTIYFRGSSCIKVIASMHDFMLFVINQHELLVEILPECISLPSIRPGLLYRISSLLTRRSLRHMVTQIFGPDKMAQNKEGRHELVMHEWRRVYMPEDG